MKYYNFKTNLNKNYIVYLEIIIINKISFP